MKSLSHVKLYPWYLDSFYPVKTLHEGHLVPVRMPLGIIVQPAAGEGDACRYPVRQGGFYARLVDTALTSRPNLGHLHPKSHGFAKYRCNEVVRIRLRYPALKKRFQAVSGHVEPEGISSLHPPADEVCRLSYRIPVMAELSGGRKIDRKIPLPCRLPCKTLPRRPEIGRKCYGKVSPRRVDDRPVMITGTARLPVCNVRGHISPAYVVVHFHNDSLSVKKRGRDCALPPMMSVMKV